MSKYHYGADWTTPVLILNCKLGGLAIMRTLGKQGTPIYGIDDNEKSEALRSKYLKKYFVKTLDPNNAQEYLDFVIAVAKIIGTKAVLVPTSDDLSLFVAEYGDSLSHHFYFPINSVELLDRLADKQKMFHLATEQDIPTPQVISPKNIDDVHAALSKVDFPLMLKAIDGNKLFARTGKKMVIVNNKAELLDAYEALEDPDDPNLMLQELIPGDDDQVYIFNGYFNENSECLAAFTGHKIRQFPIHVGCAALGECSWHERVARKTIRLMQAVGYRGILDIGYRLDPRDGKYKVLDINPRVGQAFRLFVAENDMDVIRSLYLDMTKQPQPQVKPREGRRWLIENYDFISSYDYFREGSMGFKDWLRGFKGVEECAWFNWSDLTPFLIMSGRFIKQLGTSLISRTKRLVTGNRTETKTANMS